MPIVANGAVNSPGGLLSVFILLKLLPARPLIGLAPRPTVPALGRGGGVCVGTLGDAKSFPVSGVNAYGVSGNVCRAALAVVGEGASMTSI